MNAAGAMPPVMQLTRRGAVLDESGAGAVRDRFAREQCASLAGLIAPDLAADILALIARTAFHEFAHGEVATELRLDEGTATGLLHFLLNDPRLFRLVETITGCATISAFAGRVYRRFPGRHHDSWHGDVADPRRLIGMSVNLSAAPYDGGVFEIREVDHERLLAALPNPGVGDAILFRLSPGLEHRVTEVRGDAPKTAFAGWFFADLDFARVLRTIERS